MQYRTATLVTIIVALVLAVVAASAAASSSITVSPSSVAAGGTVTVSGSAAGGCSPGSQITLISKVFGPQHEFAGVPAIIGTTSASGNFSVGATIPGTRAPGTYTITGRCGGGNLGQQATLEVTAGAGGLPRTGFDAGLAAGLGALLAGAGVALRRRTA